MNKLMLLLILTLTLANTACSEHREADDFAEFDKFKDADLKSQEIDCQSLTSTKILKGSFSPPGRASTEYSHNVLDYMFIHKYTFKACAEEIEAKKLAYCTSKNEYILSQLKHGRILAPNVQYLCNEIMGQVASKIYSTYQLPTKDNKFIVLDGYGVMIDPADVTLIKFAMPYKQLWELRIYVGKEDYSMYFSSEALWEKAKAELAGVVTAATNSIANHH